MNTSSTTLPAIVALNNIRSLHNVGAIFRTADAVQIEQLLLGGLTPMPPRHEIAKTALGATHSVPWEYVKNLGLKIQEYKSRGYTIYAVELTPTTQSLFATALSFPAVFIFGHERQGIEAELLALADYHIAIPMRGSAVHSLNVSNCVAVALYEALRQLEVKR